MSEPAIYDRTAERWARDTPQSLSDFTGRPAVIDLCEPAGATILDLGCGEGYCARIFRRRGAASVTGVDGSERMIAIAQQTEATSPLGIDYRVANVLTEGAIGGPVDVVSAVFLFNYLTIEEMTAVMTRVHHVLRPGGRFVFAVPHPSFAFMHDGRPPFYFERGQRGYFGSRDRRHRGQIDRIDGQRLDVAAYHKTLEDYIRSLADAGFRSLPEIRELGVQEEHLSLNPEFFGPVADLPLHLAVRIEKLTRGEKRS
ncbi:MAG: class I SAM-dependent methyltransferase [Myxococcota bacterium]